MPSITNRALRIRVLRKSAVDPASGCWLWQGSKNVSGYGRMAVDGRTAYAHRVAYEACIGPIPDGLTIDHLCGEPSCVNPAHLEPVTMRTNILRSSNPCAVNATREQCVNGHALAGGNLRVRPDGRRVCRTCVIENARRWRSKRHDATRATTQE